MISEEDKEKVKQLRLSGMSYKDVAKQLGYSRDEVRNYCKKNSRAVWKERLFELQFR